MLHFQQVRKTQNTKNQKAYMAKKIRDKKSIMNPQDPGKAPPVTIMPMYYFVNACPFP